MLHLGAKYAQKPPRELMSRILLIGRVMIGPALVLLVLFIVAGGQISASLDLLYDVRQFDRLQTALRSNSEAVQRLAAAQAALLQFKERPYSAAERAALRLEADRLENIAAALGWAPDAEDMVKTDRELLLNFASLLQQTADSSSPGAYYSDIKRVRTLLDARLKGRDQDYHVGLSERAASARREAEEAIPVAILLGLIGVMTALGASLYSARALSASLSKLAQAMRRLGEGREDAALVTAGLGSEFKEIAGALNLFQKATVERNAALAALAESEEGLKRVLDAAPVPLAMTKPSEARLIYANRLCRALFKVENAKEGMDVRQFYASPEDRDRFVEHLRRHGEVREHEMAMRLADGSERLMLVSAVRLVHRQEPVLVMGYSDVTERRALLDGLQESEEKLRMIVETTPVPLVLTRVSDDTVIYANRQALDLFRVGESANAFDRPASDFWLDPNERAEMKERLGDGGAASGVEVRLKRADGDWFWARLSAVRCVFRGEAVLLVSVEDVTHRRQLEEELRRLASIDPLTGVANRRRFLEAAQQEQVRAKRFGHPLSLLYVDADRLRRVNMSCGHETGDRMLAALARRLKAALRDFDGIGRVGGDKFAVLLPETPMEEALAVAERLRLAAQAEPILAESRQGVLSLTVSVGATEFQAGDAGLDEALLRTDMALAKAKEAGGNCVRNETG